MICKQTLTYCHVPVDQRNEITSRSYSNKKKGPSWIVLKDTEQESRDEEPFDFVSDLWAMMIVCRLMYSKRKCTARHIFFSANRFMIKWREKKS